MDQVPAFVAAAVSLVTLFFIYRQVAEMKRQTTLQRQVAESASQPYIWADIRVQSSNGWNLELVVGNSGPTVATGVTVDIDPPLPANSEGKYVDRMHETLRSGLSSLPPGRELYWTLGPSADLVNGEGDKAHEVRIKGTGPHGALPALKYVIDMNDFKYSVAKYYGTVQDVANAVDRLGTKLERRLPDPRRPRAVRFVASDPMLFSRWERVQRWIARRRAAPGIAGQGTERDT